MPSSCQSWRSARCGKAPGAQAPGLSDLLNVNGLVAHAGRVGLIAGALLLVIGRSAHCAGVCARCGRRRRTGKPDPAHAQGCRCAGRSRRGRAGRDGQIRVRDQCGLVDRRQGQDRGWGGTGHCCSSRAWPSPCSSTSRCWSTCSLTFGSPRISPMPFRSRPVARFRPVRTHRGEGPGTMLVSGRPGPRWTHGLLTTMPRERILVRTRRIFEEIPVGHRASERGTPTW